MPSPSSSFSRLTSVRREQPHLGRPGGGVGDDQHLAVGEATPAWCARPDRGRRSPCHRPNTPPTARRLLPAAVGEQVARWPGRKAGIAGVPARPAPPCAGARGGAAARAWRRRPWPGQLAGAACSARPIRGPRVRPGRSRSTVHRVGRGPSGHASRYPSRATSNLAPASSAGTSSRHRRGDQHLLGGGDHLGQPAPALAVELGEDVVEDQHRIAAVGPEQVVGGQPQRERERPRLAVAGVAARGQLAEAEDQVVAVRADEARRPRSSSLRGPPAGRAQQPLVRASCGRDVIRARRTIRASAQPDRCSGRPASRRGARRGERRVGAATSGRSALDQLQPRRQQLRAVPGQVGVPDLQGAQDVARAGRGERRVVSARRRSGPRRACEAVRSSAPRCLSTRS